MLKFTGSLCLASLHWMTLPLRRYADFQGLSCRKDYWLFQIIHVVLIVNIAGTALVPVPVEAQTENAVTVAEWRKLLANVATDDDDAMLNVSSGAINASTALINAGDRAEALRKSMMGLVLSRHIMDRKERQGHRIDRDQIQSTNTLQNTLVDAGVSLVLMRKSAVNLGIALNEPPTTMMIKAPLKIRPATPAERAAMISVVKNSLIDPTSPIFGRADVVGNQACLTVNSKNRFGGYTGNQEAVLYYNSLTKTWKSGGTIDLPHGVCLDISK